MPITASGYITARDPGLATAAGVRLDPLIEIAREYFSSDALGAAYEKCVALLVLHWLTLEAIGGGAGAGAVSGAITQEKEGELSRSYGQNSGTKYLFGFLDSTSYGRELDSLIRSSVASYGVTGPNLDPTFLPSGI